MSEAGKGSELETIRGRVRRARKHFRKLDGVVLTTFNLNASFLEENALPAILDLDDGEARTAAARRSNLHELLGTTPCTVYYDPAIRPAPQFSGDFRYVARPVPLRRRFFHPKLVVLAGGSEDETSWVYLAVSSANLTMSGWGHNVESFGETWIHTRKQQSWQALHDTLAWLGKQCPLGEKNADSDAVSRVLATLRAMPDRRRLNDIKGEPWSGTLHAEFYSSVAHKEGFPSFLEQSRLKGGRPRSPTELWAYAPYWSDVAGQVAAFGSKMTHLVPALRRDGEKLGLSHDEFGQLDLNTTEIRRNDQEDGIRFWHMKAYEAWYGDTCLTAVGSCNFTGKGLVAKDGNVEAMLVLDSQEDWLMEGKKIHPEDLAVDVQAEEEAPEPVPVAIVVAWDWQDHVWRWWLDASARQRDFKLHLPGEKPFPIQSGLRPKSGSRKGTPPGKGERFKVTYRMDGKGQEEGGEMTWEGAIVELNLDHSSRTYGRPLTATEILESWRGRTPAWEIGDGERDGDDSGDDFAVSLGEETSAAFDAVNLYDFYRAMRDLRTKLSDYGKESDSARPYLVGRPDSVMALAHLAGRDADASADRDSDAPAVRYLVLKELHSVVREWASKRDRTIVAGVRKMKDEARVRTLKVLERELNGSGKRGKTGAIPKGKPANVAKEMLAWFEKRLTQLDREVVE